MTKTVNKRMKRFRCKENIQLASEKETKKNQNKNKRYISELYI